MGGYSFTTHLIYITRWIVLAIPGAMLLQMVRQVIPDITFAMLISQGILGAAVFFVDRWIFRK